MLPAIPQLINKDFRWKETIVGSGGIVRELGTQDQTRILLRLWASSNFTYSTIASQLPTNCFTFTAGDAPIEFKYSDYGVAVCIPWYGLAVGSITVFEVFYRPQIKGA